MTAARRRHRWVAVLTGTALVVTACTAAAPSAPQTTSEPAGATPSPTPSVTQLDILGVSLTVSRGVPMSSATTTDVYAPDGVGPWPTVVFLHGDPPRPYRIVEDIAVGGAVVFDARWRPPAPGTTGQELAEALLTSMQDAACAVSFASRHARDYSGDKNRLVVVGHSAGASVGMVAALSGNELLEADSYDGDCAYDTMHGEADVIVGLAGSYDPADAPREPRNAVREADPDLYERVIPHTYLDSNPDDPEVLLVHGEADTNIPVAASIRFDEVLRANGFDVELKVLEDVGHSLAFPDPNPEVYDAVVAAILEAATG